MDKTKIRISHVLVDLTNICQYRCRFCWYHGDARLAFLRTVSRGRHFFPLDTFRNMMEDLRRFAPMTLTVTSEGDPCLHPQLSGLLACARAAGLRLVLQTNLAAAEVPYEALRLCHEVCINLSFLTPAAVKALNPSALPQREIERRIKILRAGSPRPRITIVYILTSRNCRGLKRTVLRLNRMGVDAVQFKPCEIVAGINEDLHLDREAAREAARVLLQAAGSCRFEHNIKEVAGELVRSHVGTGHFRDNPVMKIPARGRPAGNAAAMESDYIWRSPDRRECLAPLSYLYVRLNGEVYTCARNSWLQPVGNVFKQRLAEIIGGKAHRELIRQGRDEFDITAPQWRRCRNCYMDFAPRAGT